MSDRAQVAGELVRELKALRKGRGILDGRLATRVGPGIRAVCGVADNEGSADIRRKVTAWLTELAHELSDDLELVTVAAFAVHAETRHPLYQDRVLWAARRVDRDSRTVRRRVDEAVRQLAELASIQLRDGAAQRAGGWRTTELSVAVALDRDQPEVLERRRVVADRDGIRELELTASLPGPRAEFKASVFYGGTLLTGRDADYDFALALPKPLEKGQTHDFVIQFFPSSAETIRPYVVCVPRRPCDRFDLRVRFGDDRPPHVHALDGALPRDTAEHARRGKMHSVNDAGEIHLHFAHLAPGLAFGARWDAEVTARESRWSA